MEDTAELHLPYGFVSHPEGEIGRARPRGHDVIGGKSGQIECELEALSPFLVMDSDNRAGSSKSEVGTFKKNGNREFIIPGTSLKGMIRSVFEVLWPSCMIVDQGSPRELVPDRVRKCRDRSQLCPACRTFGFMGRGSGSTVHRGRVNVGQAWTPGDPEKHPRIQLVPHFEPNPDKSDRYWTEDRRPRGRKFYYHQHDVKRATTQNDKEYGQHVEPLKAGATFRFTVAFEGLENKALDTLVAALTLTDAAPLDGETVKVRHKLGYGKPAGLGSVNIQIRSVRLDPSPETRYRQFEAEPEEPDDLESWVQNRSDAVFQNPTEPVQDLIRVLRYPPPEGRTYGYPQDYGG
ncbi:MAG: RAMP superfamily CRISPR-associated protein [Salinibacter sp.]